MGLDSYLYKRKSKYDYESYSPTQISVTEIVINRSDGTSVSIPTGSDVSFHLDIEVAYWRKHWWIHEYFVRECTGGAADYNGIDIYVPYTKLLELYNICKSITEANTIEHAEELFDMYFDTNDWYGEDTRENIERTCNMLRPLLFSNSTEIQKTLEQQVFIYNGNY